jgi:hypothetical protein
MEGTKIRKDEVLDERFRNICAYVLGWEQDAVIKCSGRN